MRTLKYVKIPINPYTIKQKMIMGLTKRQVICFAIGAGCGLPPFFIVKAFFGVLMGVIALFVFAFPAILCGFYEKNGIFFEQTVKLMFNFYKKVKFNFKKSEQRVYKSHNAAEYAELAVKRQQLVRRLRNG
jgi:hypothetical protein